MAPSANDPISSKAEADSGARGLPARIWPSARLALVLAMLGGLVVIARPSRLWQAISEARYLWMLAAIPFTICATSLDALKLYWLIKPVGFRGGWWPAARTTLVVNFVSQILPGTVGGGAVAWHRLSSPDKLRAQVFVALSLNAALKLVTLCGIAAAALALDVRAAEAHRALIAPLAIIAALPALILALILSAGLAGHFARRVQAGSLSRVMPFRLRDAIRKILESLEAYRSHRLSFAGAFAAGVGRLLVGTYCPLFCLYAVGVTEIPFTRVLWIWCAVEAASMVPFALSGWGLPQVTAVALLAACGVSANLSLGANVVAWIAWLPIYLLGAAAMLHESLAGAERARLAK